MKEELDYTYIYLSFNELYADMIKKGFHEQENFILKRYLFG